MGKIGLKYPCYALGMESNGAITYANGAVLAKAISANIKIDTNDVKLWADDVIAESDVSFVGGTITFNPDDLSDAVKVAILNYAEGAEVDVTLGSKELSAGSATTPPIIGLGFYGKRIKDGVTTWRAIWLKKVRFKEPADDFKTKAGSVEFITPSLEGTIMEAADGKWKEEGTFALEATAIAWLQGKAGITAGTSNNLSALAFSNGVLTPVFAAANKLYSCALSNNTAITATFAAGTAKVYLNGAFHHSLTSTVEGSQILCGNGENKVVDIVIQESGKATNIYRILIQNAA
jgi:phi13 family phage major tail protein